MPAVANPIVHLELHTGDLHAARDYYGQLFDWPSELVTAPHLGSYLALDLGSGLGGGIVECGARHPLWLPYVEVASVRAATDRALALGARVLLAPREGPGGWRSVVSLPGAGEVAFWQGKLARPADAPPRLGEPDGAGRRAG
jgi:predicted enzyme related to lactoylglutathione lyase